MTEQNLNTEPNNSTKPGFERWMLNQGFSKETKDKIKQLLNG